MTGLIEKLERGPVWSDNRPIGSVVGEINGATMREAVARIRELEDALREIADDTILSKGRHWHNVCTLMQERARQALSPPDTDRGG